MRNVTRESRLGSVAGAQPALGPKQPLVANHEPASSRKLVPVKEPVAEVLVTEMMGVPNRSCCWNVAESSRPAFAACASTAAAASAASWARRRMFAASYHGIAAAYPSK